MNQKEIDFIQKRWAGRACGTDVKKLVDEIARLEEIIEIQTDTIEGHLLDKIGNQPDLSDRVVQLEQKLAIVQNQKQEVQIRLDKLIDQNQSYRQGMSDF